MHHKWAAGRTAREKLPARRWWWRVTGIGQSEGEWERKNFPFFSNLRNCMPGCNWLVRAYGYFEVVCLKSLFTFSLVVPAGPFALLPRSSFHCSRVLPKAAPIKCECVWTVLGCNESFSLTGGYSSCNDKKGIKSLQIYRM